MKRFFVLLLALVLAGFFAGGCRTAKNTGTAIKEGTEAGAKEVGEGAEKAGKKMDDAAITAAIKAKFANDETVSAKNIDVDTKNGVVTLNGTVASQAEADKAKELAQSVDGVKTVNSNLMVHP